MGKLSDADEGGSEPPTLSEEFPSQPSTPMTVADEAVRAGTPAATEEDTNRAPWPSIGDLNNRLRRVITSYQRNFKKEELKLAQKAKVNISVMLRTRVVRFFRCYRLGIIIFLKFKF